MIRIFPSVISSIRMRTFFRSTLLAVILLLIAQTRTVSQEYTADPLPTRFPGVKGDLYMGADGRVTVIGVSETTSVWTMFDTWETSYQPYVATRETDGTIRLTESFHPLVITQSHGFGGERVSFNTAFAQNSSGVRLMALRRRHEFWSDIIFPRVFQAPTVLFGYVELDSVRMLFDVSYADNPWIAADLQGNFHAVWESVSPLYPTTDDWAHGPDSNYYFTTSRIAYRVVHAGGALDSVATLGSGFQPRIQALSDGGVSVFWLRADSSNSPVFQLMHARSEDGVFTSPTVISNSVRGYEEHEYNSLPPEYQTFVDDSGGAYAAWSVAGDGDRFGHHIIRVRGTGVVRSDTAGPRSGYNAPRATFAVDRTGTAIVLWENADANAGGVYYSENDSVQAIFSNALRLNASNDVFFRPSLFFDSKGHASVFFAQGIDKAALLRDLASNRDSIIQVAEGFALAAATGQDYPYDERVRQPSAVVDEEDQIWFLGQGAWGVIIRVDKKRTGVEEQPTGALHKFFLSQNYPNPFNPATLISFTLPERAHVRLDVHDLLGRTVMTLVDGEMHPGTHLLPFSAGQLAGGVYVYRLVTPAGAVARRMTIIR